MSSKEITDLFLAARQQQLLAPLTYTSNKSKSTLHPVRQFTKYLSMFQGISKLKGAEMKLHIDPTVVPVAQQARRIPFHVRKKVEVELEEMEQKRHYRACVWSYSMGITSCHHSKTERRSTRVCMDMQMANQAIVRERYPMSTIDDLIHTLNGATFFSKLNLRSGYHQLLLSPESRYITTFATHKGLWRYTRLNFGTNSASEIFQKTIQYQLKDIPGSLNISDDTRNRVWEDTSWPRCCSRCCVPEICRSQLDTWQEVWVEQVIYEHSLALCSLWTGLHLIPKRLMQSKMHQHPLQPVASTVSLGMTTYWAKFILKFSDVSAPLRELTMKSTEFHWSDQHEKSSED